MLVGSTMENGLGIMADKFSGMVLKDPSSSSSNNNANNSSSNNNNNNNNNNNDNLYQVIKAVEAAEDTIKKQVEENNLLRSELQKRSQELEKYKTDESIYQRQRPHSVDPWNERVHGTFEAPHSVPAVSPTISSVFPLDKLLFHPDSLSTKGGPAMQTREENHLESRKVNGTLNVFPSSQTSATQLSSPSSVSFSPSSYRTEGESDPRFNLSERGLMAMTDLNTSSNVWKQDLLVKFREHEEEIMQLRKHLAEYSIKEAQIRNEKYVLEKRIAHMRLAFDQQQQDLVDAASKALSYRQDIIEENIRLTYALQAAQLERSTFVSSLLPLLAEYSLQPPVPDAQSIVSNLKVLFKHLQEKLIFTEAKLKESQHQLAPWHSDNKNGLELVPQPTYSHGNVPISSSDTQTTTDWDLLGRYPSGLGRTVGKNPEPDDLGRYSPLASRNAAAHDAHMQLAVTRGEIRTARYGEEATSKQVTFSDPVSSSEMDHPDAEGHQNERDPIVNWSSGNFPYANTFDDPSSSHSPYLPPVLEERSSSFSEAADDDPLPAIENLQISGEAYIGRELQACGFSINGTTSCNFEWVRHWEDGSFNYIEGAKQPSYLITADDVDAYLAIEVQPLDDRKRKGELVKVFANENRKITCDPEMQNQIEKTLYSGHASYKLSLSTRYLDIWEPATLAIKREGYSIKSSASSGVVITEKFLPTTTISIPYGQGTEFSIVSSGGVEHLLRTDNSSTDVSCSRDTIVLTMRLFIIRASEKRKVKRKSLFFNK